MSTIIEVAVRSRRLRVDVQNLETSLHLRFSKVRRPFVALVGILVVYSAVMLASVFAALHHEENEVEELGIRVIGVVNVRDRL